MRGSTIEACGDASKVFKFIEAAFDKIAAFISLRVVRDHHFPGRITRDDRFHVPVSQMLSKGVAVVGTVGNKASAFEGGQHFNGLGNVTNLSCCQLESQRPALPITDQVNFSG